MEDGGGEDNELGGDEGGVKDGGDAGGDAEEDEDG